jgi:hypothetical protein
MFAGCHFFVLADAEHVKDVKKALVGTGGTYLYLLTRHVTHVLVHSLDEVRGDLLLEKATNQYRAVVVALSFVFDSIKRGQRLKESDYVVLRSPSNIAPPIKPVSQVRLFVSSTFRDMVREREVLASHVFPMLESYCEEQGVLFESIDLRWGVVGSLPLVDCLSNIETCNYFVAV